MEASSHPRYDPPAGDGYQPALWCDAPAGDGAKQATRRATRQRVGRKEWTMATATPLRVSTARLDDVELVPWPFRPEQVLDGEPRARGAVVWRSDDRRMASGFWECTPGSFGRVYPWSETSCLLEGEAAITAAGETLEVVAGDLVVLPQGVEAQWEIRRTVCKAFQLTADEPLPV